LIVGSFERGFFLWLFAMGLLRVVGGSVVFEVARRSLATRVA